ncbi:MAG: hypothetical protein JJU00_05025 [Opitutales bacterium]|nr:hypothetical protein [Opitutales bacterium]
MKNRPYIRIKSLFGALLGGILLFAGASLATAEGKAGPKPPLGVDALVKVLDSHAGKPVSVYGIVHLVSAERRMFAMIDTSEADCTEACSPNIVLVRFPANNKELKLPERGREIVVSGRLDEVRTPVGLEAAEIVDSPDVVKARKALAQSE